MNKDLVQQFINQKNKVTDPCQFQDWLTILEKIGKGREGVAFKVCLTDDCEKMAVLKKVKFSSEFTQSDFNKQMNKHKSINETLPNSKYQIRLIDYGICDTNQGYTLTEYGGVTLVDYFIINKNENKDECWWLNIFTQILKGIQELDSINKGHGDLTIENILIKQIESNSPQVVFIDYGEINQITLDLFFFVEFVESVFIDLQSDNMKNILYELTDNTNNLKLDVFINTFQQRIKELKC